MHFGTFNDASQNFSHFGAAILLLPQIQTTMILREIEGYNGNPFVKEEASERDLDY